MPDQDDQLAGGGDCRHLVTAPVADPQEEAPHRTRRLRRCPGRLDQQPACMGSPMLADPAVLRQSKPRLSNARIEPEVTDQLLRLLEAGNIADRRNDAARHDRIDACNRQQPLHAGIIHRVFGDVGIQTGEILGEPVDLPHMATDRPPLVLGQFLFRKPVPAALVEQVGMGALRHEVRLKDGMHLILDPRSMPHDLVATSDQPAQPLSPRIRRPDLRQEAACLKLRQDTGIDLVGLDPGMRDRLDLHRVSDNHPGYEG